MQPSGNPPQMQKAWPPQPPDIGNKLQWVGGAMIGVFLVLVVTGIIPELRWLFVDRDPAYSPFWLEALGAHTYWAMILFFLLGGIGLFSKRRYGYVFSFAACGYWIGMRLFSHVYLIAVAGLGYISNTLTVLGLSIPPSVASIGTLLINAGAIWGIIMLRRTSHQAALGVDAMVDRQAMLLGAGMLVWSIFCFFLKQALTPQLPYAYFQF